MSVLILQMRKLRLVNKLVLVTSQSGWKHKIGAYQNREMEHKACVVVSNGMGQSVY
jgi:hypothetical protein